MVSWDDIYRDVHYNYDYNLGGVSNAALYHREQGYGTAFRTKKIDSSGQLSDKVKVISCNVYQFNTEHQRFVQLVTDEQPDIVITMESNLDLTRRGGAAAQLLPELLCRFRRWLQYNYHL